MELNSPPNPPNARRPQNEKSARQARAPRPTPLFPPEELPIMADAKRFVPEHAATIKVLGVAAVVATRSIV
jgi:hypothetical protein